MLQLAANIYADADASNFNGVAQPPVFRPQFQIQTLGRSNVSVTITNFQLVTNNGYQQLLDGLANPTFFDLSNSLAASTRNGGADANFWGVPWVVGSVKGNPEFNEFDYSARAFMDRKMYFVRKPASAPLAATNVPPYTNQFYEMWISNSCGLDLWNPYTNTFYGSRGQVVAVASNYVTVTLTNNAPAPRNYAFVTNITLYQQATNLNATSGWWAGWLSPTNAGRTQSVSPHMHLLQTNYTAVPLGYYSESLGAFYIYTNPLVAGTVNQFLPGDTNQTTYPTYNWSITVTNHLFYILFDGQANIGNVLDFVNLGPFGSSNTLSQQLQNDQPAPFTIAPATYAANSPISQGAIQQINGSDSVTQYYLSLQDPASATQQQRRDSGHLQPARLR